MQADTTICNLALGHLKITETIANVLTEDSVVARQCRLHWTPVLREVLRAYPWRFATKRWSLGGPSDSDKPVFRWDYAYKLPEECLRIIKVYGADQREMDGDGSWAKEGNCVVSNEEGPLYLKGVQLIEDANLFDDSFINALGFRLAAQIAPGVGESKQQGPMLNTFRELVNSGQSIDSSEAAPPKKKTGGWSGAYRR
ncbi:MAG: hypothetical protein JEY79_01020 [Pseudodesulfovibrio sp.]|nr:hypothetical protein [Pseudodesulfovibrio sp.]